jgi:PAB1-binding protein PBP1
MLALISIIRKTVNFSGNYILSNESKISLDSTFDEELFTSQTSLSLGRYRNTIPSLYNTYSIIS